MADIQWENISDLKGQDLPMLIEECIPGALIVCLKHGIKEFRGLLMDVTNKDLSYGLGFKQLEEEIQKSETIHPVPPSDIPVTVDPNVGSTAKLECSALGYRHTYSLNPANSSSKLLSPPKRDFKRSMRDKNIRAMRLRPRRVLCSKCKHGINDSTQTTAPTKPNSITDSKEKQPITILKKTRQMVQEFPFSPKRLRSHNVEKLSSKSHNVEKLSSKSPVIKISFGSKQGRDTVVKIPSKCQSATATRGTNSPTTRSQIKTTDMSSEDYKKYRKAMKKAKREAKHRRIGHDNKPSDIYHKRSKHSKHKLKRKHRKQEDMTENSSNSLQSFQKSVEETQGLSSKAIVNHTLEEGQGRQEHWSEDSDHGYENSDSMQECEDLLSNVGEKNSNHKILTPSQDQFIGNSPSSWDGLYGASNDCAKSSYENGAPGDILIDVDYETDENQCPQSESDNDTESVENGKPLTMKIKTRKVNKCAMDGKVLCNGDIVWGKIHGFPWWPGKVSTITVSQRDNGVIINQIAHVEWFGSSTNSFMPCSELHPFLQHFKTRFNKKKKGVYKTAIKEATLAAKNTIKNYSTEEIAELEAMED